MFVPGDELLTDNVMSEDEDISSSSSGRSGDQNTPSAAAAEEVNKGCNQSSTTDASYFSKLGGYLLGNRTCSYSSSTRTASTSALTFQDMASGSSHSRMSDSVDSAELEYRSQCFIGGDNMPKISSPRVQHTVPQQMKGVASSMRLFKGASEGGNKPDEVVGKASSSWTDLQVEDPESVSTSAKSKSHIRPEHKCATVLDHHLRNNEEEEKEEEDDSHTDDNNRSSSVMFSPYVVVFEAPAMSGDKWANDDGDGEEDEDSDIDSWEESEKMEEGGSSSSIYWECIVEDGGVKATTRKSAATTIPNNHVVADHYTPKPFLFDNMEDDMEDDDDTESNSSTSVIDGGSMEDADDAGDDADDDRSIQDIQDIIDLCNDMDESNDAHLQDMSSDGDNNSSMESLDNSIQDIQDLIDLCDPPDDSKTRNPFHDIEDNDVVRERTTGWNTSPMSSACWSEEDAEGERLYGYLYNSTTLSTTGFPTVTNCSASLSESERGVTPAPRTPQTNAVDMDDNEKTLFELCCCQRKPSDQDGGQPRYSLAYQVCIALIVGFLFALTTTIGVAVSNIARAALDNSNAVTTPTSLACNPELSELKVGRLDFILSNVPQDLFRLKQDELEVIFQTSYNKASGMCEGLYERVLEQGNIRMAMSSSQLASWTAYVNCIGCPDHEPLFSDGLESMDNVETLKSASKSSSSSRHQLAKSHLTNDFLERFIHLLNPQVASMFNLTNEGDGEVVYLATKSLYSEQPEQVFNKIVPDDTSLNGSVEAPTSAPTSAATEETTIETEVLTVQITVEIGPLTDDSLPATIEPTLEATTVGTIDEGLSLSIAPTANPTIAATEQDDLAQSLDAYIRFGSRPVTTDAPGTP